MSSIQEIAEQLVNLSVKEVNELSMILKNDFDIPECNHKHYSNNKSSPKKYGQSLKTNKQWMKNYIKHI